jgi:pimeloyl-ACP methyl ester carboxylesterase
MLNNKAMRAGLGLSLLVLGALLTFHASRRYTEKRYIVDAGACRMDVLSTERADLTPASERNAVVLFHGISANKIIMQYLARTFAEMGLRVYTPDLPGHGRSPGPFTPAQAEACSLSLVRGLTARGMIYPERTILAGHSMGGALAIRVAEKFRPAGVIAISPAPMVAANGAQDENLLFHSRPVLTPNTLVMVGQFEPRWMTANASDLASASPDPTVRFKRMNWNTHVSVLFSRAVARECQRWAARVLNLPSDGLPLPSRANLLGGLLGLMGILLLAGPFLREAVAKEPAEEARPANLPSAVRMVMECALVSFVAVFLLHYAQPLRFIHLFEGAYLASFFLIVGAVLLLLHPRLAQAQLAVKPSLAFGAAFAALVLHFLITGWFELTLTGSWMTLARWLRFPVFFFGAFVFFYALESLLGPATLARFRIVQALLLIAACWLALASGVLYFKSGEILTVLLLPYFALCFFFTYLGAQLVRRLTASATAAAVFGAILLAGFCLALFPLS